MKTLVWFRDDLRLADNPALHFAASNGSVLPVYIYPEGLGAASYWWLHYSLVSLIKALARHGVELILRTGPPEKVLLELCQREKVDSVVWNRVYSPHGISQGQNVKAALRGSVAMQSFNGQLLIEPAKILNKQGLPFKVFTPFWRHCAAQLNPSEVLPEPSISGVDHTAHSESIDAWCLLPTHPNWAKGLFNRWQPGEAGAQRRWGEFLDRTITHYKDGRDFPARHNTSYLSPHLAFGEISVKKIWLDMQEAMAGREVDANNGVKFLSEIGWREFSRYLLVHYPHIIDQPFNQRFQEFPWRDDKKLLEKWKRGQTGYPIVDAGMRELWISGYMHNRVRMVAASFLTKHCLTHWREGMDWFWDTLVDADIANNTASWQWASGCGADAAPYFRIFNPVLQGERFDKEGDYIKKWVPELTNVPTKYIHKPWEADAQVLKHASVTLGENYPYPIVDHREARARALAAYQSIKNPA